VTYVGDEIDEGLKGWWWKLSLDPGVVEIQTAPTPGATFDPEHESTIGAVVDADIFGVAGKLGFTAGGGGGHVNVDFATGFGEDYSLIPKVLLATEAAINTLRSKDAGDETRKLVEFENEGDDPFLSTPRRGVKTKENDRKLQLWDESVEASAESDRSGAWKSNVADKHAPTNAAGWEKFRKAHAQWLFSNPSSRQYLSAGEAGEKFGKTLNEENLAKVLHYQAINIDHLKGDAPGDLPATDTRRLEFRFFRGQASVQDIMKSVRLIGHIKEAAGELGKK
jgi:hypothetical protein